MARARAYVAAIHAAVTEQSDWAVRVFPRELRRRFGIPQGLEAELTTALLETPWATPIRRRDGVIRSWCLVPDAPAARPLRELILALPRSEDGGGAGRRGRDGREALTGLSEAQRKAALSLATLIERTGARVGLSAHDGPALLSRPDLADLVAELSDTEARDAAARAGTGWSPATNTMRPKLVSAVRNLQTLARRLGVAASRDIASDRLPPAPASKLVPLIARLRAKLDRRDTSGQNAQRIDNGLRLLGRVAAQFGWHRPSQVDASTLRDTVERLRVVGRITDSDYYAARHVWRRLHVLHNLAPFENRRPPAQFFDQALVRRAIELRPRKMVVELATDDPAITPDGNALLDGPYGLRRVIRFLTAAPHLLHAELDLPARRIAIRQLRRKHELVTVPLALAAFRESQSGQRQHAPLCDSTALGLCVDVRRFATYARENNANTDATIPTLATAASIRGVAQARGWIMTNERHEGVLAAEAVRMIDQLSSVAWAAAQLAVCDGDEATAHCFLTERAAMLDWRNRFEHEGARTPVLKKVIDIDTFWRGRDNVPGFLKLGALRDCIVGRAVRRARLDLEEQVKAIQAGMRPEWACRAWAIAIRNAFLVHLMRMLPLRSREVSKLTRGMLRATKAGRPAAPWDAGAHIAVLIPKTIMKASRDREATLGDTNEDPVQEARFCRHLFALYLMPGGARDMLSPIDDTVFVSLRGRALRPASISGAFSSEVCRYAKVLNMDLEDTERLYGATRLHAIRALIGRYVAHDLDRVYLATLLLHHSSIQVTVQRYVGLSGRHARLDLPN